METTRSRGNAATAVLSILVPILLAGAAWRCAARTDATDAAEAASPVPPLGEVDVRLFLIGDAGGASSTDPVLKALSAEIRRDPDRSLVVFLGDNIYPRGMPAAGSPLRRLAERRLEEQIDTVEGTTARAIFLPGNHDWDMMGADGWEAVVRQGRFIEAKALPNVALLPPGGCPGPVVHDAGTRARVVVLDTQWWLHAGPRPLEPNSPCPEDSELEVLKALEKAVDDAGDRRVVVVAHHPLASGGIHGGYFSWRDHVFPLRAKRSWLWIPLPGIGSAYPYARRRGITEQDLSGTLNVKMREAIEGVFKKESPLVYAAGHEHNLQVLRGPEVKWLLVSGTGYFNHLSRVVVTEATVFAREASGYMRLDFAPDGKVRLAVLTVDARGRATESFNTLAKD